MGDILAQLGINNSFLIQLVLFFLLFLIIGNIYFRPFLRLFEARHKRTVEDRDAAKKLMEEAEEKFNEYQKLLSDARLQARKEYEGILAIAKDQENEILQKARDEAKRITQDATSQVEKQRDQLKRELESDVNALAESLADRLLVGKKSD